jgi:hypothetical protein
MLALVRHPSLPENEDDSEEFFSEMGDFTYSDFDQSSFSDSDQPQIKCRQIDKPINIQMQKTSLSKQMPAMSDFTHSDFDQSSLVS